MRSDNDKEKITILVINELVRDLKGIDFSFYDFKHKLKKIIDDFEVYNLYYDIDGAFDKSFEYIIDEFYKDFKSFTNEVLKNITTNKYDYKKSIDIYHEQIYDSIKFIGEPKNINNSIFKFENYLQDQSQEKLVENILINYTRNNFKNELNLLEKKLINVFDNRLFELLNRLNSIENKKEEKIEKADSLQDAVNKIIDKKIEEIGKYDLLEEALAEIKEIDINYKSTPIGTKIYNKLYEISHEIRNYDLSKKKLNKLALELKELVKLYNENKQLEEVKEEIPDVDEEATINNYYDSGYDKNFFGWYFNIWTDEYDKDYNPLNDETFQVKKSHSKSR